jgi:cytochrome oxidase Cu insertion factor (SCO1/SenC/PrrC family)
MNKQAIIIVFALFLTPVIVAILLHSEWFSWQPGGTRNHGELIQPVIPLPDFDLLDAGGHTLSREDLADRWFIIHRRHIHCDDQCLEDLYWMRQIRRAQDRHQPDIGLMLVSTAPIDDETLARINELAEDFLVVHGDQAEQLLKYFPETENSRGAYITDPMVNIILGYAADADPNGIRRDLRRLLTWTQRD